VEAAVQRAALYAGDPLPLATIEDTQARIARARKEENDV
jgi:hypothetical protein